MCHYQPQMSNIFVRILDFTWPLFLLYNLLYYLQYWSFTVKASVQSPEIANLPASGLWQPFSFLTFLPIFYFFGATVESIFLTISGYIPLLCCYHFNFILPIYFTFFFVTSDIPITSFWPIAFLNITFFNNLFPWGALRRRSPTLINQKFVRS